MRVLLRSQPRSDGKRELLLADGVAVAITEGKQSLVLRAVAWRICRGAQVRPKPAPRSALAAQLAQK